MMYRAILPFALLGLMQLAACGRSESPPPATEPPATSPPAVLSPPATEPAPTLSAAGRVIDLAAAQALLSPDETLQSIAPEDSNPVTVTGEVSGYKSTAWAIAVGAGKTLSVRFEPSNTNLYMNVVDAADTSGAAVHRSEVDGAQASIVAGRSYAHLRKVAPEPFAFVSGSSDPHAIRNIQTTAATRLTLGQPYGLCERSR